MFTIRFRDGSELRIKPAEHFESGTRVEVWAHRTEKRQGKLHICNIIETEGDVIHVDDGTCAPPRTPWWRLD